MVGTLTEASEFELEMTLLVDEKENLLGIVIIWELHGLIGKLAGG